MAVVKEYFCPGHGPFEGTKPICPKGCTVAEREFRTAPSIGNAGTRRTDDLIRSQVEAMGLSNIRTNLKEGDTARINTPAVNQALAHQEAIRKKFASPWGTVPKAGVFKAGLGPEGEIAGGGAIAAFAGQKTRAAVEVEAQSGMAMNADFAQPVRGLKHAYEAVKDPQGLKVDVSKAA